LFWSSNSLYFYYTDAREGVPDGCGYWSQPVRRLDVQSLNVEELGGGPKSPDGTMYATWQGKELLHWQIDQAEITRLPATVAEALPGPIAWSPDNQALVYLQFDSDCPPAGKSYLVHVDLATGEQHLLIESDTPRFGNVTWYAQSQLILFGGNSEQWYYDLATGTLEPVP
jgi:hypothetical protein